MIKSIKYFYTCNTWSLNFVILYKSILYYYQYIIIKFCYIIVVLIQPKLVYTILCIMLAIIVILKKMLCLLVREICDKLKILVHSITVNINVNCDAAFIPFHGDVS